MHLPSFLWLWRIAAWSMGWAIACYIGLAIVGLGIRRQRLHPQLKPWHWLRRLHYAVGMIFVGLITVLLAIGIVGTLGHFGSLGHSWHLSAGLFVVTLTYGSAWSATRIHPQRPWARPLHLGLNGTLCIALVWVGLTGLSVVQKYIP